MGKSLSGFLVIVGWIVRVVQKRSSGMRRTMGKCGPGCTAQLGCAEERGTGGGKGAEVMGAQPTPCKSGVEHYPWSSGHPSRVEAIQASAEATHTVSSLRHRHRTLSVYPHPLTSHLIHFSASSHPSTSLTHVEHRPSLSLHPPTPPSLVGGGCRRCCGGGLCFGSGWAQVGG